MVGLHSIFIALSLIFFPNIAGLLPRNSPDDISQFAFLLYVKCNLLSEEEALGWTAVVWARIVFFILVGRLSMISFNNATAELFYKTTRERTNQGEVRLQSDEEIHIFASLIVQQLFCASVCILK